ncbi:MAG: SGNH/GDSL hydrolase family protein [Nitrospirae bacterium]|nr:SGNH/GDSL hydrolase family protein [Nitrospirota bacterium]
MTKKERIMLVGASVGKAWKLSDFSLRTKSDGYIFESVAAYQYDKTEAIEEILMRPKRKFRLTRTYLRGFFKPSPQRPDTIIIKECAAYFPGDLEEYKTLMTKWVKRIREDNIKLILATTVPVTQKHAEGRKGRNETILEFNDWVREYAEKEGIPLLDLEAALRTDGQGRFLRDDLTSGDGLHLNQKAYGIMDNLLQNMLGITT